VGRADPLKIPQAFFSCFSLGIEKKKKGNSSLKDGRGRSIREFLMQWFFQFFKKKKKHKGITSKIAQISFAA